MKPLVIVDYGMGNIYSVQSALKYIGVESVYTNDSSIILDADHILLPGVGSFHVAMENIKRLDLDDILKEAVLVKQIPILGICLGMQLLGMSSTEDGYTEGLKLFDGKCDKFEATDLLKVPHVGFNDVKIPANSRLYTDLDDNSDFYFVHSYRMQTSQVDGVAYCDYGGRFVASFEKGNVMGTQYHPEKSQRNGLTVLQNFINI
jgi:glutamine amidotransferase